MASEIVPPVETTFPQTTDELPTSDSGSQDTTIPATEVITANEPVTPPVPDSSSPGHDPIVPPVTWPVSVTRPDPVKNPTDQ